MSTPATPPLEPILPWSSPTDAFNIYAGEICYETGLNRVIGQGVIDLVLRSGSHLHWSIEEESVEKGDDRYWRHHRAQTPETIRFRFRGTPTSLTVHRTTDLRGFIPNQPNPINDVVLRRVVAHWVNLPRIPFGEMLRDIGPHDGWREWGGRHELKLGDWHCTIDQRADHEEVFKAAKADYLHATTHVMEIKKADNSLFAPSDAADFLMCLQFGVSFALSRWVAPIVPVGFGEDGSAVWTQWAAWHVDPPGHGSGRWWTTSRPKDLWSFLRSWAENWQDVERRPCLSFIITSALAAGEKAFVEQRLMTALAALENLSWMTDVLDERVPEERWRKKNAAWRIRRLLDRAAIPGSIDPILTPKLFDYSVENNLGDGPAVITDIRHSLTHPKNTASLYQRSGLVAEAARLSRKYLDYLFLHHLGYRGCVADRTCVTRWEGEVESAPWTTAKDTETSAT